MRFVLNRLDFCHDMQDQQIVLPTPQLNQISDCGCQAAGKG